MKIAIALITTFVWAVAPAWGTPAWGTSVWGSSVLGGEIQDISIPQAPRRVDFADVTVKLTPKAQQIVNDQIRFLLTPEGEYLNRKVEKMQWYFPIIEEILEEEGVPDDFKYIAVLESSLEPNSVSTSNAVGFWQFKQPTAREMGLRMDGSVDERKEIFLSTRAAAMYLKRNNGIVNNWVSALLTYNLGTGGVSGIIPSDWSYAKEVTFDENTHPYLIKALAHRIAFEHRINRLRDSDYQFVVYPAQRQSLNDIAKTLVVDVDDLQKYNAWLIANRVPQDKSYNVLVPVRTTQAEQLERRINNNGKDIAKLDVGFPELQRLTPESADASTPILYKINGRRGILAQPGDEVPQLASKAKVGVYKFLSYNDMTERDQIESGKVYYSQKKNRKAKVPYHTVAEGETMGSISHMYGIRMKNMLTYNRLKTVQNLLPGRVVWLQKKRPKNQPIEIIEGPIRPVDTTPLPRKKDIATSNGSTNSTTVTPPATGGSIIDRSQKTNDDVVIIESDEQLNKLFEKETGGNVSKPTNTSSANSNSTYGGNASTHMVKQGETLFSISQLYNVSVDELRRLNNMSSSTPLQSNQRLVVRSDAAGNQPRATSTPTNSTNNSTSAATTGYHTVAAGETMFRISQNYGISVDQLRAMNGLSGNAIAVGQRLRVGPGGNTGSSASSTYSKPASTGSVMYHTVAPGETLYRVSVNYKVSVENLRSWNNLNGNTISVGQKLLIKK